MLIVRGVCFFLGDEKLLSYILGIVVSPYEDPFQLTSRMEFHRGFERGSRDILDVLFLHNHGSVQNDNVWREASHLPKRPCFPLNHDYSETHYIFQCMFEDCQL